MFMMKKIRNIFKNIFPFIIVLLLWQFFSFLNIFPDYFFPAPKNVLGLFFAMIFDGSLLKLIAITLFYGLVGFLIGGIIALFLVILSVKYKYIGSFFFPLVSAGYPIPGIVWVPLSLIWFGFTIQSIIFVVSLASFFNFYYNAYSGIKNINPLYLKVAKNLNIKGFKYVWEILILGSFPFILNGLRMAVGASWRVIIGAEMLTTVTKGLGWFLWRANEFFNYNQVFLVILSIALVGFLLEEIILRTIERRTLEIWY
jgi:NitT/TauT family transport system permease protein